MPKLIHPYTNISSSTACYRGNLHAHTTNSDGKLEPQELVDRYAANNYDFLMISDHDIHTGPEDHARLDSRGMVLIPGNEISKNGAHLLHVDSDRWIEPNKDRQIIIDEINLSKGFAIMNHPNWQAHFNHCPLESLQKWNGYVGIEIFNGVIGWLKGTAYALDKWDLLLSEGRRIWGYANDDFHWVSNDPWGWNMVYAEERSSDSIVAALRSGRFYASTGVVIDGISVDGMTVTISAENADRIIALTDGGMRVAVEDSQEMTIEVPESTRKGQITYVRFECWGKGEECAWTQPFFLDD